MIHVIQCMCPQRHAILATAYDSEDMPDDIALAIMQNQIEGLLERKVLNPWCGICGSEDWHYEQARTAFKTMREAWPTLHATEAANLATGRTINELKASKN